MKAKYKIVTRINESEGRIEYTIARRWMFFFWDRIGEEVGLVMKRVTWYIHKQDAIDHLNKLNKLC